MESTGDQSMDGSTLRDLDPTLYFVWYHLVGMCVASYPALLNPRGGGIPLLLVPDKILSGESIYGDVYDNEDVLPESNVEVPTLYRVLQYMLGIPARMNGTSHISDVLSEIGVTGWWSLLNSFKTLQHQGLVDVVFYLHRADPLSVSAIQRQSPNMSRFCLVCNKIGRLVRRRCAGANFVVTAREAGILSETQVNEALRNTCMYDAVLREMIKKYVLSPLVNENNPSGFQDHVLDLFIEATLSVNRDQVVPEDLDEEDTEETTAPQNHVPGTARPIALTPTAEALNLYIRDTFNSMRVAVKHEILSMAMERALVFSLSYENEFSMLPTNYKTHGYLSLPNDLPWLRPPMRLVDFIADKIHRIYDSMETHLVGVRFRVDPEEEMSVPYPHAPDVDEINEMYNEHEPPLIDGGITTPMKTLLVRAKDQGYPAEQLSIEEQPAVTAQPAVADHTENLWPHAFNFEYGEPVPGTVSHRKIGVPTWYLDPAGRAPRPLKNWDTFQDEDVNIRDEASASMDSLLVRAKDQDDPEALDEEEEVANPFSTDGSEFPASSIWDIDDDDFNAIVGEYTGQPAIADNPDDLEPTPVFNFENGAPVSGAVTHRNTLTVPYVQPAKLSPRPQEDEQSDADDEASMNSLLVGARSQGDPERMTQLSDPCFLIWEQLCKVLGRRRIKADQMPLSSRKAIRLESPRVDSLSALSNLIGYRPQEIFGPFVISEEPYFTGVLGSRREFVSQFNLKLSKIKTMDLTAVLSILLEVPDPFAYIRAAENQNQHMSLGRQIALEAELMFVFDLKRYADRGYSAVRAVGNNIVYFMYDFNLLKWLFAHYRDELEALENDMKIARIQGICNKLFRVAGIDDELVQHLFDDQSNSGLRDHVAEVMNDPTVLVRWTSNEKRVKAWKAVLYSVEYCVCRTYLPCPTFMAQLDDEIKGRAHRMSPPDLEVGGNTVEEYRAYLAPELTMDVDVYKQLLVGGRRRQPEAEDPRLAQLSPVCYEIWNTLCVLCGEGEIEPMTTASREFIRNAGNRLEFQTFEEVLTSIGYPFKEPEGQNITRRGKKERRWSYILSCLYSVPDPLEYIDRSTPDLLDDNEFEELRLVFDLYRLTITKNAFRVSPGLNMSPDLITVRDRYHTALAAWFIDEYRPVPNLENEEFGFMPLANAFLGNAFQFLLVAKLAHRCYRNILPPDILEGTNVSLYLQHLSFPQGVSDLINGRPHWVDLEGGVFSGAMNENHVSRAWRALLCAIEYCAVRGYVDLEGPFFVVNRAKYEWAKSTATPTPWNGGVLSEGEAKRVLALIHPSTVEIPDVDLSHAFADVDEVPLLVGSKKTPQDVYTKDVNVIVGDTDSKKRTSHLVTVDTYQPDMFMVFERDRTLVYRSLKSGHNDDASLVALESLTPVTKGLCLVVPGSSIISGSMSSPEPYTMRLVSSGIVSYASFLRSYAGPDLEGHTAYTGAHLPGSGLEVFVQHPWLCLLEAKGFSPSDLVRLHRDLADKYRSKSLKVKDHKTWNALSHFIFSAINRASSKTSEEWDAEQAAVFRSDMKWLDRLIHDLILTSFVESTDGWTLGNYPRKLSNFEEMVMENQHTTHFFDFQELVHFLWSLGHANLGEDIRQDTPFNRIVVDP